MPSRTVREDGGACGHARRCLEIQKTRQHASEAARFFLRRPWRRRRIIAIADCRHGQWTRSGRYCACELIAPRCIACLNAHDWPNLGKFVHDALQYNGRALTLDDYRELSKKDVREIHDLRFHIELLITEPPRVACRLRFECMPKAGFLGLHVDGRRVVFCENVFCEFRDGKIERVWSVIHKAAIEAQL
jgi:predicted ester cyclase